MSGTITDIGEARRRRLTPTGRALLGTWELASFLSPIGPEPPSEELLEQMLALPPSDRAELAEIFGARVLEIGNYGPGAGNKGERKGKGGGSAGSVIAFFIRRPNNRTVKKR